MIYALVLIGSLLQINAIYCTSMTNTSADDVKQAVNFSGKLVTHQGQEYIVDNISINGKYKQIPMYDKPAHNSKPILNEDSKQTEIKLENNPADDFTKTKIDLSEINEISVPSPETVWFYQKKERHQKLEFTEVVVTTKSNTKTSYLVDRKTRINCDSIDSAGPQEKQVPLSAVKTLAIEGFACRTMNKNTTTTCPIEKK